MGEVIYTVLTPADFVPREQITLNPEQELPQTRLMDLQALRRGVAVRFAITDNPANIEAAAFYSLYYQQAAYKEGWRFEPNNYRIFVLPPGVLRTDGEGRVHTYDVIPGEKPMAYGLSAKGREGFRVVNDQLRGRLGRVEADTIADLVDRIADSMEAVPREQRTAARMETRERKNILRLC